MADSVAKQMVPRVLLTHNTSHQSPNMESNPHCNVGAWRDNVGVPWLATSKLGCVVLNAHDLALTCLLAQLGHIL